MNISWTAIGICLTGGLAIIGGIVAFIKIGDNGNSKRIDDVNKQVASINGRHTTALTRCQDTMTKRIARFEDKLDSYHTLHVNQMNRVIEAHFKDMVEFRTLSRYIEMQDKKLYKKARKKAEEDSDHLNGERYKLT